MTAAWDRPRVLGVATSFVAGVAMAAQYRVNGALGRQVDDGAVAATISFGLGLVLLVCLLLAIPSGRRSAVALWRKLSAGAPRWQSIGGVFGAFLVTTQVLTAGPLGIAVFTVAVVAGQTAGGLLIDSTRLAPGGPRPVTRSRLTGAGLVVAAMLALHMGSPMAPTRMSVALLPVLAGIGVACQHTLNGRMRDLCGSSLAVAFANFSVGTAALATVLAVDLSLRGLPDRLPTQLWLYLGGPLGVLYVALIAAAVRSIGTFQVGLTVVLGQVLTASALGLVASEASTLWDAGTAAATVLAVLAVGVAGSRQQRSSRTRIM